MGLTVLKWIRQQPDCAGLVVIMISAYAAPIDIESAYCVGANAFLVVRLRVTVTIKIRHIEVRIRAIELNEDQRNELMGIAQSRSLPAGYVMRAKLILLLDEGVTFAGIRERLETTNRTIIR
jgi:CheY-like chemotaxis protein